MPRVARDAGGAERPLDRRVSVATCSGRDEATAAQIRDAAARGAPLRLVGRGTWLEAGHPVAASETLSLADDAGVVEYAPGDLVITVRAGTTLSEIADALRSHDQWLALDPIGGDRGTIGATIATSSYGPAAALYGTPRDQVLGLTVVTGRGDVLHAGGRVVKNVAGFDLARLMTGAWGTLGVITQATLRVRSTRLDPGSIAHLRRIMPASSGYREPRIVHPALAAALQRSFDPAGILNPGIMGVPAPSAPADACSASSA